MPKKSRKHRRDLRSGDMALTVDVLQLARAVAKSVSAGGAAVREARRLMVVFRLWDGLAVGRERLNARAE